MVVAKLVKHLNLLKDNEAIGNKLYHSVKLTDSSAPRFHDQPKLHNPGVTVRLVVLCSGLPLCDLN